MGKTVKYTIGSAYTFQEIVRDSENNPVLPTSCLVNILDDSGAVINSPTASLSTGLVSFTMANDVITEAGTYTIEWDVTYDEDGESQNELITTTVIAEVSDDTYLMSIVPRVRVWIGDYPTSSSKRIHQDEQIKLVMEEVVRTHMDDYELKLNDNGLYDIDPVITDSTDEKKLVLWTAYFLLMFWNDRIRSESTPMFRVEYDNPYRNIQNRIDAIIDELRSIDSSFDMPVLSETDIETYGQMYDRLESAMNTWNT